MAHRPEHDFMNPLCQPFLLEAEGEKAHRHGVLLIHGFTGTAAHMRPLAELLHQRGFTVMGINLPGHAATMDAMADCTWQDWLDAARDAFHSLQERCTYVSVAGLSMGGCLTLLVGQSMQPAAIAPISAPMGTRMPLWMATVASPFLSTIWWKQRRKDAKLTDLRYDIGYQGFRSRCARHLARLIRMSRQDLHAVTCPVLVVQSKADMTIAPDSAAVILRGVSSARKGVLWLENAPHVCTLSPELEKIASALCEHFRQAEKK